jgi:hypothetical protein
VNASLATRALGLGVGLSALLLAAGLLCWSLAAEPWAARLLEVGLLVLMATPAARVAITLVEYIRLRDWFFVATTLAVLAILAGAVISALLH